MASTYSTNLRLELIGTGEQQGTWGLTTNTNLGTLLEQAIGGYEDIPVSDVGDTTLTISNGAADQSRNMTLNLSGTLTATRNVICPAIEKIYVVKNATSGGFAVTFKVTGIGQTGVSIPNGATMLIYVDGVDARQAGAAIGASNALVATSIELGGTTDTTITRSSAGVIAVEGGVIPKENRANTFTASQTIANANLTMASDNIYEPQVSETHASATAGSAPYLIQRRARGTIASPSLVSSGDILGTATWFGYDGSTYREAASINAFVDGTPGASDMPGRLIFSTTPDGGFNAAERMRIDSSGNVGIGGASSGTKLQVNEGDIYAVKSTGITQLTMTSGTVTAFVHANSGGVGTAGTSSNHQLWLMTNSTQRAILGTDGSFVLTSSGGLGYGTGSGGTVTQATSKSTGVTLNKTNGQIVTNNAALADGATASFQVTNSTVASTDTIIVNSTNGNYRVKAFNHAAGSFSIGLTNESGGSLSDAVTINFSIIKATTA